MGKNRLRASCGFGRTALKSRCFCLTSIELLAASLSSARRLSSRNFSKNAERLSLSISNMPQIELLFKKRLTVELTRGETDDTQAKGKKTAQ